MQQIKENELLSKYTTFHIGGKAKFFVIVKNIEELGEALKWAKERNEKYFILGGGSNVLFVNGFDGLVIKIVFIDLKIEGETVEVGAGVPLLLAVKKSVEAGLGGIENLAGIPGSVGGAVSNNAGAYGGSIEDAIERAELFFPEGRAETVNKDWFEFKYRNSKLKAWQGEGKPVLTRVWLKLEHGDRNELKNKMEKVIAGRQEKEPKGFCAGCAFKNIKGDIVIQLLDKFDFTEEERERFGRRRAIPTAWFIEHAGLKGYKLGGAYIPEEHANYIMNDGTATADHILQMLSYIKQQVRDKFGVQLEEEIQIIN